MRKSQRMTTGKTDLSAPFASAHSGAIGIGMLAALLGGCGTTVPPGTEPVNYTVAPRDLLQVVSVADSHAVRIGGAGYLGKPERDRLDAFVVSVAQNRPESLRVALRGWASSAQFKAVADVLVADGVTPANIVRADARSGPPVPRGTVAVAVERAIAVLPDCPGWVDHPSAPEDNRIQPNFGCSDVSNFAAMVSDPHHLSQGASSIYEDGERAASSVADYHADKIYDKWLRELPKSNEQFSVIPTAR
jgi:pilus biogenesis lipoprotein CpaD